MTRRLNLTVALLAASLVACDGQQYVSPDTVALVVTNESTGVERVNRCHFIPVLLGSEVKVRYSVEDDLKVTISITRDEVRLDYEQPGQSYESYQISAQAFDGAASVSDDAPPDGYRVELSSPCTPRE